jgi:hypothetical protein
MDMKTRAKSVKRGKKVSRNATTGRIIGAKAFEAITAVEGLKLSPAGKKRLAASKSRKQTPAQRRAEVVRAYTASKGR